MTGNGRGTDVVLLAHGNAVLPTISELAETVNREHALAMQAAFGMLSHAIAAGEALLSCQVYVPEGTWRAWVETNVDVSWSTANDYMRAAHFRDYLEQHGVTQLEEALTLLRGHRRKADSPGRLGLPDLAKKARRMNKEGVPPNEIVRRLGVSKTTVYWWLNPQAHAAHLRKLRRQNETARRLRDQKRDQAIRQAVRKRGGALAEAYAMAERMQDVLGQAHREAEDRDQRRYLALAGQHYRKMRDDIVKALGVTPAHLNERRAA